CASATTGTSAPTRAITAAIFRLIGRLPWLSNLHPYDARTSTLDAGVADAVPPTPSAPQTDVVRQLVDVVGTPRKEAREAGPHLRDGADDGAADGARAKPLDHPVAHASPVVVAPAPEAAAAAREPSAAPAAAPRAATTTAAPDDRRLRAPAAAVDGVAAPLGVPDRRQHRHGEDAEDQAQERDRRGAEPRRGTASGGLRRRPAADPREHR